MKPNRLLVNEDYAVFHQIQSKLVQLAKPTDDFGPG